ncbi:glycoside hydrolase family 3 N-terminal domain-containing protein [Propionibacteriaceae bacterium G1746]
MSPTSRRAILGRAVLGGALLGGAGLALAGCAGRDDVGATTPAGSTTGAGSTSAAGSPTATGSTTPAGSPGDSTMPASSASSTALDLVTVVGQLLMVGHTTPSISTATRDLLTTHQFGSLVLLGNQLGGRGDLAAFSAQLGALDVQVPVLVAVDQEGGQIQRLNGQGFSRIPTAVAQGELGAARLQRDWTTWGQELARVGVHYNLAPVADVVPADLVARNAPIGQLKRHYGTTNAQAIPAIEAVVKGLAAAKVASSLKHFPGLGRVSVNTDFGVARDDSITGSADDLAPFAAGIAAGASSVMVSSAIYERIDPDQQGVFSSKVITGLLRGQLGFEGVVIADDLGAAAAVKEVTPGERALRFLRAGGDLVITADPFLAPQMAGAILQAARADAAFEAELRRKADRVLALKRSVGVG